MVITVVLLLQDENIDGITSGGMSKTSNAMAQYAASTSGSCGNLYPDVALPGTVLISSVLYFQIPFRQWVNTHWMNSFVKFFEYGLLQMCHWMIRSTKVSESALKTCWTTQPHLQWLQNSRQTLENRLLHSVGLVR
jgi:hypothetical protein